MFAESGLGEHVNTNSTIKRVDICISLLHEHTYMLDCTAHTRVTTLITEHNVKEIVNRGHISAKC